MVPRRRAASSARHLMMPLGGAGLGIGSPAVTLPQALLAMLIFAAGACVQGAVGFGANLIAAPLLVLLSDRFVPGPVTVASGVLNLLVTWRSPSGHVDPTVRTAILGQVVGALAAGAVLSVLPGEALSILFSVLVLGAVGLSLRGRQLLPTRRNLT